MAKIGDMKIVDGGLYRFDGNTEDGRVKRTRLGSAEPVAVDGKDRVVQFELDGELHRVGSWAPDGSIREYTAENRPADADKPKAPERTTGETAVEVAKGVAKGAGKTVAALAPVVNFATKIVGGGVPVDDVAPAAGVRELERMTELENTPQKVGAGIESGAEMMLTGGPVKKAAATLATKGIPLLSKAPALLRAVPKVVAVGSEAANAAGNAAMHGEDPGVAAALSGGFTAAGEALSPLAARLYKSARDQYGRVMAATTNRNKNISERLIPELIKRGVVGSAEGIRARAEKLAAKYGQAIADAVETTTPLDPVYAQTLIKKLEAYKKEFIVNGESWADDTIREIEDIQQRIANTAKDVTVTGEKAMAYKEANKVRQILDAEVDKAGGYAGKTLAEGSKIDVKREAASAIREELAKRRPDIAKLNKEFGLWQGTADVLADTSTRRVGQAGGWKKVLQGPVGAAVGGVAYGGGASLPEAVIGGAGAMVVMGMLREASNSGALNTLSAIAKDRLATAIVNGDAATVAQILGRTAAAANQTRSAPRSIGEMVR